MMPGKVSNDKSLELHIQSKDKIRDIKKKIQKQTGVDVKQQKLLFKGEELNNDKTAGEYDIYAASNLFLVISRKNVH